MRKARPSAEERVSSPHIEQRFRPPEQASHSAANLSPYDAGTLEAPPPRSPLHRPQSLLTPGSPLKHARKPSASEENKPSLTLNGIHDIVSRRDLQRGTTQSSNDSGSTTRRNRFVTKIIGSKPSSPDPDDRMSLTIHRADLAVRSGSSDYGPATSGDELPPTNFPMPPINSALRDSTNANVPSVPERNVSLTRPDHEESDGRNSRQRSRARSRLPRPINTSSPRQTSRPPSPQPPPPQPPGHGKGPQTRPLGGRETMERQRCGQPPSQPPHPGHGRARQTRPEDKMDKVEKTNKVDDGLYMMSGALQDVSIALSFTGSERVHWQVPAN